MSFGGGKSKSTRGMDPMMQEYMAQGLEGMSDLAQQVPATPDYYPGQNWVDASADTRAGQNLARQIGAGSPERGALGSLLTGTMGQQNYNLDPAAQTAMGMMGGLGAGQNALAGVAGGQGVDQMMQQAMAGGPADQALAGYASGRVNPLTAQMYQQAAGNLSEQFNEGVVPNLTSMFTAAGGGGSDTHALALTNAAGELADAQAGLAAEMFGGASEAALGRGLQASGLGADLDMSRRGLASQLFQGGQGNALAAGQALQQGAGAGLQGLAGLQGQLSNQALSAAGMAPLGQNMDLNAMGALLQSGGITEQFAGDQLAANMDRYQYDANKPMQDWQRQAQAYGMLTSGVAPLAGFGTTTGSQASAGKGK